MKKKIVSLMLAMMALNYDANLPVQACVGSGRVGYIDLRGKLIVPQKFALARKFAEGLAAVKIGDKWGYIDKTGKVTIAPQFDKTEKFAEGLAAVWMEKKWGFVDKKGKLSCSAFRLGHLNSSKGTGNREQATGNTQFKCTSA